MARKQPTVSDHVAAATLHKRGHSYAQIAKALDLTPDQVRSSVAKARELLDSFAVKFAADAIRASHVAAATGNHRPARDMLDRLGVTNPALAGNQDGADSIRAGGVTINIGFAMPGVPRAAELAGAAVSITSGGTQAQYEGLSAGRLSVETPTLSPPNREAQSERVQDSEETG